MIEYRFFRINAGGMVDSGVRIRLADDEAAAAHARTLSDDRVVEVWAGQRRVLKLPPSSFAQSA